MSLRFSKHTKKLLNLLTRTDRWSPAELFHMLLMDVMADIYTVSRVGLHHQKYGCYLMPVLDIAKKERAWSEQEIQVLGPLTETYGQAIRENMPFEDILGPIYEELAGPGRQKAFGQYFTPVAIADLMSGLLLGDLDQSGWPRDRVYRVLEPTSGAGTLLLSFVRQVLYRDEKRLPWLELTAVDKDSTCALMTAVQLFGNAWLHAMPLAGIRVYRGNSLGPWTELDVVLDARHCRLVSLDSPRALDDEVVRPGAKHLAAARLEVAGDAEGIEAIDPDGPFDGNMAQDDQARVESKGQVDLFAALEEGSRPRVSLNTRGVRVRVRQGVGKSSKPGDPSDSSRQSPFFN